MDASILIVSTNLFHQLALVGTVQYQRWTLSDDGTSLTTLCPHTYTQISINYTYIAIHKHKPTYRYEHRQTHKYVHTCVLTYNYIQFVYTHTKYV